MVRGYVPEFQNGSLGSDIRGNFFEQFENNYSYTSFHLDDISATFG